MLEYYNYNIILSFSSSNIRLKELTFRPSKLILRYSRKALDRDIVILKLINS